VQERLTGEIAEAIQDVLAPHGVGVVVEAYHLCMMMRGVEKQNSKTLTSALLGCFRDEKEMLATLCCIKQKDGELFPDQTFALTVFELGRDEDDDAITGLVARAVLSDEEKAELVQREAVKGRSGRNAQLLELAQNGMRVEDLRRAFYEACDLPDTDSRRQAYFRAMKWAKSAGLIEVVEGFVLLSKPAQPGV